MELQINDMFNDDRLLNLINNEFDSNDQKLFINSFKQYMQYGDDKSFVINLEDILDWIGIEIKGNAKRLLKDNFKENVDYIEMNDDEYIAYLLYKY